MAKEKDVAAVDIAYEQLPQEVKDNVTADQWRQVLPLVIADDQPVPDTTYYINLKNGQIHRYEAGQPAHGPLLAVHDLAGGRGADSTQFHTAPAGAHTEPRHEP